MSTQNNQCSNQDMSQLISSLTSNSAQTRDESRRALINLGENAIPLLLQALNSSEAELAGEAAVLLGLTKNESVIKPLLEALENKISPAAIGLMHFGQSVAPVLIPMLKHEDWNVRRETAGALGFIGDPGAVKPLADLLQDKVPEVRRTAAQALGRIGGGEAINFIRALLVDDDSFVRDIAQEALVDFQYFQVENSDMKDYKGLVLLVFEFSDDRIYYARSLENMGYKVIAAKNEKTTFEQLAQINGLLGQLPGLIICDLALHLESGITILRRLQTEALYRDIPFVFKVVAINPPDGLSHIGIIRWRISPDELLEKMANWIKSH